MGDETLVSPADIARLADVGRSAVSNWRRRYPDFPEPAGGTPAAPLYALAEVEEWLRGQGKLDEAPLAERAWQALRAQAGDDLHLTSAVAAAGETLLRATGAELPPAVAELAAARGAADAFELLLSRLQDAQGRAATVPAPEIIELAGALAANARTVLDPACGTGELLLAARDNGASRLLGQDASFEVARLAAARLGLGLGGRATAGEVTIRAEDALLRDAFPGVLADAVLCAPPPNWRAGEHEPSDPRWVYGVPPRLEPELAWVQHMVAHLAPDGTAVAVVPAATAGRRPGRRIRAQLLRKGALRAVIAASPTQYLWVLGRPAGTAPATVLMVQSADPVLVTGAWQRFAAQPDLDEAGLCRGVPVIDLLDDEVDLTPARYLSLPAPADLAERFADLRERLTVLLDQLPASVPDVRPAQPTSEQAMVTIAELARLGHLQVLAGPGRARPELAPDVRPGDVVVTAEAGSLTACVAADSSTPGHTLLRVDPAWLDPYYVAGMVHATASAQGTRALSSAAARADVTRVQIPRLPLAGQRRYGEAFRQMEQLRAGTGSAAATAAELASLLASGLVAGLLEPVSKPAGQGVDDRPA